MITGEKIQRVYENIHPKLVLVLLFVLTEVFPSRKRDQMRKELSIYRTRRKSGILERSIDLNQFWRAAEEGMRNITSFQCFPSCNNCSTAERNLCQLECHINITTKRLVAKSRKLSPPYLLTLLLCPHCMVLHDGSNMLISCKLTLEHQYYILLIAKHVTELTGRLLYFAGQSLIEDRALIRGGRLLSFFLLHKHLM